MTFTGTGRRATAPHATRREAKPGGGVPEGPRVLVVDDEAPLRRLLLRNLARGGMVLRGAASGEEALDWLQRERFDVAVIDIAMPGMGGMRLLERLQRDWPEIEVIMITGHGTVETAIEAMKRGVYDYVQKPLKMSELAVLIRNAAERRTLRAENVALREQRRRSEPPAEIVGRSAVMQALERLIDRYAPSRAPVLIQGESGTGKELVARALHARSDRADGPFVAINCGALQESLLENELFGHARGAYTGADGEQPGLFEVADGGTLFIDEVCEMGPEVQTRFLRVLELGELRRLGESRTRRVDVRVVAATNRDVEAEVRRGRFREDLYYRLAVLPIETPPLRERRDDIPLLVRHYLERHGRRGGAPRRLTAAAIELLQRHDWPGNVRELFNVLERALIVSNALEIGPEDLPPLDRGLGRRAGASTAGSASETRCSTLEEVEARHIRRVLEATGGNKTRAAKELGISLRSLYRKLEKYGIGR
ncbi:MAG: sigma-54-dependent Fis family transcriptional regulator [Planctomycetota bacterium]|nr:MAG: sigma-54-dependent Fis family transcriptional regulator [Planctomycetota bacterium]